MSVAEKKDNIISMLGKLQNMEVIDKLEKLLFKLQFEEISSGPMTDDEFLKEMEISFKDFEEGRTINSKELLKEVSEW